MTPRSSDPTAPARRPLKAAPLFWMYRGLWRAALPGLYLSSRLRQGWEERMVRVTPGPADIWIQSASGGEAFLARQIVENLDHPLPLNLLLTTCTSQGMDVLKGISPSKGLHLQRTFFPFDVPGLMQRTLEQVRPKVVVLLETELWPGLLRACAQNRVTVLLLNARLGRHSLARYACLPGLWRGLAPDRILAVSDRDARRYEALFGSPSVETMPNIKFDRCLGATPVPYVKNPLSTFIRPGTPFAVLGSVRQQEERILLQVVKDLLRKRPATVVGLFPRHMHRLDSWSRVLTDEGLTWSLRSRIDAPVAPGTVIVWDTFGELMQAYGLARAVFVGGSLAPLGGQNFLEPLSQGVIPLIGKSWHNFAWIGHEVFTRGLVQQVESGRDLTERLVRQLASPPGRERVRRDIEAYVKTHSGGTLAACQTILEAL